MQPPEGPPVCTALNARPSDDAAADVEDDLAQRRAHRHFDQARVHDAAGEGEHLGALAGGRADAVEPVAAVADDRRDVGVRLDVVDERRPVPQAGHRRIRRPRRRCSASALDRGDERRLLAAHEGPGAEPHIDLEGELRVQHRGAQVTLSGRVADGLADARDGKRVLGAAVDVAHAGADRVRRDGHALEDAVGIALQDAAVHECTRVALVGVADHVFG